MPEKEFFSFDEALRELRLKEEELKRLVSEGEIRAFRDGATMKLRKADVDNLRNELSGGEVVEVGSSAEELVFEDDTDMDAGMATAEISAADTLIEEVEEVAPAKKARAGAAAGAGAAAARTAAASRRAAPVAAAAEASEGMGLRAAMILTSLVLVLSMPVALSIASGTISSFARGIAGIFAKIP